MYRDAKEIISLRKKKNHRSSDRVVETECVNSTDVENIYSKSMKSRMPQDRVKYIKMCKIHYEYIQEQEKISIIRLYKKYMYRVGFRALH